MLVTPLAPSERSDAISTRPPGMTRYGDPLLRDCVQAELRFAQHQPDIAVVVRLDAAAPVDSIAGRRQELRDAAADRTLAAPVAVERESERLTRCRVGRVEVDAAKQRPVVTQS